MHLFIAGVGLLVATLMAASGVAAVARGWVLPMNRGRVLRTRLYGCGQLLIAVALSWQMGVLTGLVPLPDSAPTLAGSVLLIVGLILLMLSQRSRARR
ncbi:hypothetical protein [Streptomyces sp. NPDC050145]|uniref:hypothetical protein n=1 Tax=Streptomyces sp. NPDC050145 TaxID=3365602 RepID=UPI0037A3930A